MTIFSGIVVGDNVTDINMTEINITTDIDSVDQQILRKVLRYPVVKIPYDGEMNIFDDAVEPVDYYKITFGTFIYTLGGLLLIIYGIIIFSEKF